MRRFVKKIFRRLACRAEKVPVDDEYRLASELIETEVREKKSQQQTDLAGSNGVAKKKKRRSNSDDDEDESRYMKELKQTDPFSIEEVTGELVDIRASFAPRPKWWNTVIKFVIFAWITFLTADGFIRTSPKLFYFATFDHWANLVSVIYLGSSLMNNALRRSSKEKESKRSKKAYLPGLGTKVIWVLYSISAPSQLFSSLAFWCYDFNGKDLDGSLVNNGSTVLLLFLEGLVLNRTPLRINHQWFFFAFVYSFLLWSMIHSYLDIGNPSKARYGREALYPFLDWNPAPVNTALHVVIILLLVNPFIYWIVWMMSLFSFPFNFQGKNRRYRN